MVPGCGASGGTESEPRRCRLCREPADESWVEESADVVESADGSDDRCWRRVLFLAVALDSSSIDSCLDFGIRCRILDGFSFGFDGLLLRSAKTKK